jgi:hypothetical protein
MDDNKVAADEDDNNEEGIHRLCSLAPKSVKKFLEHYKLNTEVKDAKEAALSPEWCWDRGDDITYYFYDRDVDKKRTKESSSEENYEDKPHNWTASSPKQIQAVVDAFQIWKDVGLHLTFTRVFDPKKAKVRIGFDRKDGSWSFVGKECLLKDNKNPEDRTMNFGWTLLGKDLWGRHTALHEIGHMLGLQHEHQSPNCKFVWDEKKVYKHFLESDDWDKDDVDTNVLYKYKFNRPFVSDEPADEDTVAASKWDPLSIMQYEYEAGLIISPEKYFKEGVSHAKYGDLSATDKIWARIAYGKK